ncbi:hypothetical protein [Streptomyces inhibens]|uniref:hypothetical protein n=1 Tax=Streptomyces inhibens TaxID=2293571 RepID=UPI0015F27C49|nr:hypothetical protein [Streptomyces inhibens]
MPTTMLGGHLRGDEWYVFDAETGLRREIRAFHASSSDGRDEVTMQGDDYAANGYHLVPQVHRLRTDYEYARDSGGTAS